MKRIVRGQRWVSEAEPELGLGTVVDIDDRSVALEFSAADVTRRYALKSAPLRRARFAVGDTIVDDDGVRLEIDAVEEAEGLLVYRSAHRSLTEERISARTPIGGPRERLLGGQVDPSALFDLRLETIGHLHAARRSPVRGFLGSRLELLPHQFYIAAEATARHAPRVLLADETGLGKTIEACLTVNRLLLCGRVARVLILVPDSLVHQWLVELRRRFNLTFAVFDEERCEAIVASSTVEVPLDADGVDDADVDVAPAGDGAENPFETEQLVLAGIGLLAGSEERARQAADAGWDLVIVDEAHHLRWSSRAVSSEYRAVEAVARGSSGLLLLTATPEQLGEESHFARLRLLDPDRYSDLARWQREAEHYRETARIAECLLDAEAATGQRPPDLDAEQTRVLASILELDAVEVRRRAVEPDGRRRLLDSLIDRHGPGRVMFRNTRAVVSGFPERCVELRALDAVASDSQLGRSITAEVEALVRPDEPVAGASTGAPAALVLAGDPRIERLVEVLADRDGPAKLLVICASAEKALAVKDAVDRRLKVDIALFHEQLTLIQRDRNAAWFAADDGARVLICSEIGSEGRNFQQAQHLMMFDLPLDPDLIEQRIGRLDRIGQRGAVHIEVPFVRGTGLEVLARWHHEGVAAFERSAFTGLPLLERFGPRVSELACTIPDGAEDLTRELDDLVRETAAAREDLAVRIERGRDRLLELASLRRDVAEGIIAEIEARDADRAGERFALQLFEHFHVYAEEIAPHTYVLNPDAMHGSELPLLDRGEAAVTFDRATALVREDLEFMTWDHPLLLDAMELLLTSGAGNAGFAISEHADTPGVRLETVFILESVAPPRLHVDRFLPPTPVVVATDQRLEELTVSDDVDFSDGRPDWVTSQQAVLRPALEKMVERCEALAEIRATDARRHAGRVLRETLEAELDRLRALAKINGQIRPEELAAVETELAELERHIGDARLRLDAMRLVWCGPADDGVPVMRG